MRRLLVILFSLSLLLGWGLPARAQGQSAVILYPADVSGFPTISAFLDVFDDSGAFVSGLTPQAVSVIEDGKTLPVKSLDALTVPAQIVVAVNPGPALGLRDSTGTARFQWITQALSAWAQARPADQQDDLSLVTLAGPIITHANVKDWLVSLNSFQPNFQASTPNLQSLSIALDTAASQGAHSGAKLAVLFITPHMDDPNVDSEIQPLITRAVQNRIHVFVWMADLGAYQATTSAAAFSQLATQTGGAFYFSSTKTFPDPETYFAPLRKMYRLKYTSAVSGNGQHTLSVQVDHAGKTIKSASQTFNVDIEPPNPILVSPPMQITRQPPADNPYSQVLAPSAQEIDIIIEFPDGHKRPLASTTLLVDGQIVAKNTKPPFDKFTWDLSGFTSSGEHKLSVQAVDVLGLEKTSMELPITVTVIQPPHGLTAVVGKYRQYILYGSLGLAAFVVLLVLLISRLQSVIARIRKAWRLNIDPLTQPVAAAAESKSQDKKKRKRPRSGLAKSVNAQGFLIRLRADLEPMTGNPIPLNGDELVFGSDSAQSSVVLNEASVAPRHARITQGEDGNFYIRDDGSVAGTWVNYVPVGKEGYVLEHGDVIHFGQLVFRFQFKNPLPVEEPTITRVKDSA